MAIVPNLR